jgi:hypothetical protein
MPVASRAFKTSNREWQGNVSQALRKFPRARQLRKIMNLSGLKEGDGRANMRKRSSLLNKGPEVIYFELEAKGTLPKDNLLFVICPLASGRTCLNCLFRRARKAQGRTQSKDV